MMLGDAMYEPDLAARFPGKTLHDIGREHDALFEPVLQVCSSGPGSAKIAQFSHPFALHNVSLDECWQAFGRWTEDFKQSFSLNRSLQLAAPSLGSNGEVVIVPIVVHMRGLLDANGNLVSGTEIPSFTVFAQYTFSSGGKISGYEQFYDTLELERCFQLVADSTSASPLWVPPVAALGCFVLLATLSAACRLRKAAPPPLTISRW